jgi:hypothetical protein
MGSNACLPKYSIAEPAETGQKAASIIHYEESLQ